MSNDDTNWLKVQATVSAERLAAMPSGLLGPAGRTLRDAACDWIPDRALAVVSTPSGAHSAKMNRKVRGDGSVQLPLVNPLMG